MSEEPIAVGAHFARLAAEFDRSILRRYVLRPLTQQRLSLYRRMRIFVGLRLREWGLRTDSQPWTASLTLRPEQTPSDGPLVVWALGFDSSQLRTACHGIQKAMRVSCRSFDVVLITDVADFAFFSRLGWLIEYVPSLAAGSSDYAVEKQRYLAWRYQGAPVVPIVAGLGDQVGLEELLDG